ncbi:N-6 DNA Methylase [Actinopolyspora mzabensis]|uniref:N-6 DNA Methylase n=1 Tax=Actinopolyspora mzabensis TaxID=995066 RepID=A0A1G9A0Y3_ACTMZ|nr:N-6 DNA methylase [Actinopolyspora mzabensis]SDK20050.1 N-6 DNA Methylase [Actinopolyspora mzabensis]
MTRVEVTSADISRMAGVTRATVSNWRRRHPDFPDPTGGTDTSPAYDLVEVRDWLAARGQLPELSPLEELRTTLLQAPREAAALLPFIPPLVWLETSRFDWLRELHDEELVAETSRCLDVSPPTEAAPETVRALLRCVSEEGAEVALVVFQDVLGADSVHTTPKPVVDLMVGLLLEPGTVFDPACGGGGLLSAAARQGATQLFGQDIAPTQAVLSEVRLRVEAPKAELVETVAADSLRQDAFPDLQADTALCNPPFGIRDWGHDDLAYDPRWVYGLPPRAESELAWVQHCLAHVEPGGGVVVLMPPGAAERASGRRVRAELIRRGALRAVIALPPGAAPPLHLGLHLWVLTQPDETLDTGESVLFIDAATENLSHERIVELWRDFDEAEERFEPVEGVAQRASIVDLLDATVDVTPARRVHAGVVATPTEQAERAEHLREQLARACANLAELTDAARIGGDTFDASSHAWAVADAEPETWRTATVADLLRGGALTLHRATSVRRGASSRNTDAAIDDMPVLTLSDLRGETPTSGSPRDKPAEHVRIEDGDVIMPETLHGLRIVPARVADAEDSGKLLGPHLFLLRPDPERLDPWFLAGFLSAEENTHRATTGTSIVRLDVKRLRVPLVPPRSQRDYGRAFQHLFRLRQSAALASTLAEETARQWATGLTSGALLPPEADS